MENKQVKYVFEKQIGKSYNINLLVHEKENVNNKWVAKISRKLAPWADFRDLDERAILASRLAKILNVKVPDFLLENINSIDGYDSNEVPDRINDYVFLTRFEKTDLKEFLGIHKFEGIKNSEELYKIFVFNLWIGSYDQKTEDYLVNENNEILSTDYQLSGPGFVSDMDVSIGGWVAKYSLDNPSHTGWCLEGAILGQETPIVEYIKILKPNIDVFEECIKSIEKITESEIEKAMEGLAFYGESETSINNSYMNFLLKRRSGIRKAVIDWIEAGYPNQIDQKSEHEQRKSSYYKSLL